MQRESVAPARREDGQNVASKIVEEYGAGENEPLGGYVVLLGAFAAAFGGSLALVRKKLPRRSPASSTTRSRR